MIIINAFLTLALTTKLHLCTIVGQSALPLRLCKRGLFHEALRETSRKLSALGTLATTVSPNPRCCKLMCYFATVVFKHMLADKWLAQPAQLDVQCH